MTLTLTPLPDIPMVCPGDDLAEIVLNSLRSAQITLRDGDILILAQKIVSKAEGRMVNLKTIIPSEKAANMAMRSQKDPRLVEVILRESNAILRVRPGTIIVEHRLGFICASAGIDHSNVQSDNASSEEWVLLLPEDPSRSAQEIRRKLETASGARVGVLVIDSHGRAWRLGTVGMVIGLSGVPGVLDERGWKDLFGYKLQITVVGVADELAAAASLVMGQAAEGLPVVHARGFPYPLREGSLGEILRPKNMDLFR